MASLNEHSVLCAVGTPYSWVLPVSWAVGSHSFSEEFVSGIRITRGKKCCVCARAHKRMKPGCGGAAAKVVHCSLSALQSA